MTGEVRAVQVRSLLASRDKAEAEIAAVLREHLDEVGEAAWLSWCLTEFGWKRRAAYNHLNPVQKEKARKRQRAHRVHERKATRAEARAQREHDATVRAAHMKFIEERVPFYVGVTKEKQDAARQVIKAGYRALSPKTHPDHGGSAEAQRDLTTSRAWLEKLVEYPQSEATMKFAREWASKQQSPVKLDDITKALSDLSTLTKYTTPENYVKPNRNQFEQKGFGVDAELPEDLTRLRDWLSEVIERFEKLVVTCAGPRSS
jgi:hypothetical protein